jgi:hypothetical protein
MQSSGAKGESIAPLAQFVKSLAEEGRGVVLSQPLGEEVDGDLDVLHELDQAARSALGLEAPAFAAPAALWGARLFYHLCQFTVCRDIGPEQMARTCGAACPQPRGPEVDWSVDLTLRHLPKLADLARHLSNADPLLGEMNRIGMDWALSSVGMVGIANPCLDTFIGHPALLRVYVDRILSAGDVSRLGDARVDHLLRADLGAYRDLSPAIAGKLFPPTYDTH